MAQTTTQKLKKRFEREGLFDFTQRRGGQAVAISTLTQRTKNKVQKRESSQRKHKSRMYE
jgi:hypothetical protein